MPRKPKPRQIRNLRQFLNSKLVTSHELNQMDSSTSPPLCKFHIFFLFLFVVVVEKLVSFISISDIMLPKINIYNNK